MKLSEEAMLAICDALSAGLSYSGAALSVGIAPRTLWFWIKQSQSGDEGYSLDYLGERVPFHMAVNGARRIMLHCLRSEFERRSYLGHDEKVFFGGMPTFQPELRAVGLDEDTRELLGYRRDGLLEIDGRVVQNTIHHEPPVAATLRVLEVAFPDEYIPQTKSTVQTTVNGMVGVAWARPMTGPPTIPPAPVPPPQLEILPDRDDDDDLAELLGDIPDDGPELSGAGVEVVDRNAIASIPAGFRADFDRLVARGAITPSGQTTGKVVAPIVIKEVTPEVYRAAPDPLIRPTNGGRSPLSDSERALLSRLPPTLSRKV